MKNRKGIIKLDKYTVQWIIQDGSLAKALFSNFFPFDVVHENDDKVYYGTSPLFRKLNENEDIPVYDFIVKQNPDLKFTLDSFEEVKPSVNLNSENKSLEKQIEDLKFQLSCYKKVANNCYGVFDNENDLNLVKVIEKLKSDNESLKDDVVSLVNKYFDENATVGYWGKYYCKENVIIVLKKIIVNKPKIKPLYSNFTSPMFRD